MNDNNLGTQQNTEVTSTDVTTQENNSFLKIVKSKGFIISALILFISTISFVSFKTSTLVKNYSDKVFPGLYLDGIEVSGFTQEELNALTDDMLNKINNKKILVSANDTNFELPYSSLEISTNSEEVRKEIFDYGKNETFFSKVFLLSKPTEKKYDLNLTYNMAKVEEFATEIGSAINVEPVNASISIDGSNINVSSDTTGYKLNSEDLLSQLEGSISNNIDGDGITKLDAKIDVNEPSITAAQLQGVNGKISTYTTSYKAGPSGTNLALAASNINNTLLMPGETFSTELAIGPTTIERGFVAANTYVGGKVVPGVGGGVCQVASTLYNTILRAGIIPTERMNHMMTVSYVPLGLDATLADNLIDLKFQNDFEYPIVVKAYAGGGSLTIELWSNTSVTNGVRYEPKSVPLSNLSADAYLYGYNENGEVVYEQYLDRSTYQPF